MSDLFVFFMFFLQTSCNRSRALPLLSTGSSPPRRVEDPDVVFQSFLQRAPSNQWDSLMGLSDSPPVEDSIIIPCEFCGVQLEEEVLFHHQVRAHEAPLPGSLMIFCERSCGFLSQDSI